MASVSENDKESETHAIVLGATSIVGRYLIEHLVDLDFTGVALTRTLSLPLKNNTPNFSWCDISKNKNLPIFPPSILFSLAPITALPDFLAGVGNIKQLIALSTSSTAYKSESTDPFERNMVKQVLKAEKKVQNFCLQKGIKYTIFRPTLIYDPGRDKNLTTIATFINRFKTFPIVWPGKGKRQPIHANEVAEAMVAALSFPSAQGKMFHLPGGETLTYREMVCRIFESLERRPLIVYLPISLARIGFKIWNTFTKAEYSVASLDRMNKDLTFNATPVKEALHITCRPFSFQSGKNKKKNNQE